MYLGDFTASKVIRKMFSTADITGAPITMTSGAISIYKDGGTTESTTGVTLTVDFDGKTGLHQVAIDTSSDGTFYAHGSEFQIVLTAGVVNGVTVAPLWLASFSLANRSALRPTTADRTLDVSAGGEAGMDWANVGSPTTTLDLSGTTVKTATDVAAYIDTEIAAIKAKTDNLPSDPADASDIAASFSSISSSLTTLAGYIDTEVAAIKAKTDNLPASPAAVGSAMTLTSGERTSVADALLDRSDAIETGLTPRGTLRLAIAALAAKVSGAGSATVVFRNAVADSKNRITATVTSDGNRTAVTTDAT